MARRGELFQSKTPSVTLVACVNYEGKKSGEKRKRKNRDPRGSNPRPHG